MCDVLGVRFPTLGRAGSRRPLLAEGLKASARACASPGRPVSQLGFVSFASITGAGFRFLAGARVREPLSGPALHLFEVQEFYPRNGGTPGCRSVGCSESLRRLLDQDPEASRRHRGEQLGLHSVCNSSCHTRKKRAGGSSGSALRILPLAAAFGVLQRQYRQRSGPVEPAPPFLYPSRAAQAVPRGHGIRDLGASNVR